MSGGLGGERWKARGGRGRGRERKDGWEAQGERGRGRGVYRRIGGRLAGKVPGVPGEGCSGSQSEQVPFRVPLRCTTKVKIPARRTELLYLSCEVYLEAVAGEQTRRINLEKSLQLAATCSNSSETSPARQSHALQQRVL